MMEKTKTNLPKKTQTYIELVYSENSKLNEITDLSARKLEACLAAGLDSKSKDAQAIMDMENTEVNEQIIEYLIQNNSNDFSLLLADQHIFASQIQQMMDPKTDILTRDKISERSDKLLIRINARMQSIFKGKEEIALGAEKVRVMRPEDRLKMRVNRSA